MLKIKQPRSLYINSLIILKEQGVIHLLVIIPIFLGILGLSFLVSANIKTSKTFPASKAPTVNGVFLAHEGSSGFSGDSSSGSSGDSKSSGDSSGSSGGSSSTGSTTNSELTPSKTFEKEENNGVMEEKENEVSQETKENKIKVEIKQNKIKVKFEIEDNKIKVKAKTEEDEEIENEDLELVEQEVEQELEKNDIHITTAGGQILLSKHRVGALSKFPLQIDLSTNQLIASTSAGTRMLTVLPDKAVQNMLAAHIRTGLGPKFFSGATASATLNDIINLDEKDGELVYKIEGEKDHNLLSFIAVSTPIKVTISAETGSLLETEQSFLARIVEVLSF